MKQQQALKASAPVCAARPPARKKKPAQGNDTIRRIREIAIAVGGFDELELPECFKHRTPY